MSHSLNKWVRFRIVLVGVSLGLLGVVLLGRFFHLQILQGSQLREEADREIQKFCPILPVRGPILDRRGTELAVSVRVHSAVAHPRQLKNPQRLSRELAPVLGFNAKELHALLASDKPFVWLKRHLTPEREEAFRAWQERVEKKSPTTAANGRRDEDAVYLIPEARRYYPQQTLAGPVLGFCNIDGQGMEGLEHQFDQDLYGKPKKCLKLIDARGRIVVTDEKAWDPEIMGHNLVLSLDRTIQYIAEKELQKGVDHWKAAGGLVLVAKPQTGEILAMAQLPTADPNHFARFSEEARRNRHVTHALEPGSAFKVFIAASALDAGVVKPTDKFHCENGVWHLGPKEVIHDVHPYGGLTVHQVIQKSSNIGAAKIAHKAGGARMDQYLKAFGFGRRTEICFPGENAGLLKNLRLARSPLDRATCAFGQGVSVTPLQLTMAMAAIGNEGVLMEPLLVKEVVSAKGDKIKEFQSRPVRRVLSPQAARDILAMMESVTQEGGTAKGCAPPGFTAAGKTGTAQKLVNRAYSHSKFNSVFMGLVPADKPVLAITVIIDESKGAIYGGVVAAPIFKEVAAQALRVLGHYPPTPNLPVLAGPSPTPAPTPKPAAAAQPAVVQAAVLPAFMPETPQESLKVMPNVKGMTIRQVLDLLHRSGLRCRLEGSGLAVDQEPSPGAKLEPGNVCLVKFKPRR